VDPSGRYAVETLGPRLTSIEKYRVSFDGERVLITHDYRAFAHALNANFEMVWRGLRAEFSERAKDFEDSAAFRILSGYGNPPIVGAVVTDELFKVAARYLLMGNPKHKERES